MKTKSNYLLLPRIYKIAFFLLCLQMEVGCKKLVSVNAPDNVVTSQNVFQNDATAIAMMTGMYASMSNTDMDNLSLNFPSLSCHAGLSADELSLWSGAANSGLLLNETEYYYYTNSLFSNGTGQFGSEFWITFYNMIYTCNSVIAGLNASTGLTSAVHQQLLGEAKFMRGFVYFYLVNLYGARPLILNTDYKSNALVSRTSSAAIYQQIIADLKDAQSLLSTQYLDPTLLKTTNQRVRPTQWAATALLARTYLYTQDWTDADAQATSIINNTSLYNLVSLNSVFLANSNESIWQLQPVITGWNTQDARQFIVPSTGFSSDNPVYLSSQLLNSFEPGDKRRSVWVDSVIVAPDTIYFAYKYKSATYGNPVTENLMVFRLAEQYLIRAEARAHENILTGAGSAASDINVIRSRAGLPPTTATTQGDLLNAIQHERQIELFTESGHRWLDLKRTAQVDAVMGIVTPQKANGAAWLSYQQLFPLPYSDVIAAPNIKQNSGY